MSMTTRNCSIYVQNQLVNSVFQLNYYKIITLDKYITFKYHQNSMFISKKSKNSQY